MSRLGVSRASTMIVAVVLGSLFWIALIAQWKLLSRGYQLEIRIGDGPSSVTHISFPEWRRFVTLGLGMIATIGVALIAGQRSSSVQIMTLTLAAILVIGFLDVREYGVIGSPTSWKLVALAVSGLIAAVVLRRVGAA